MIYLPSIENSAVVLLLLLLFPLHLELKTGKLFVGAHFHWIKVCWNCKVQATEAWNKSSFNQAHTEEAGWVRASQACSFPPSVIYGVMLGRPEELFFKIWLAFFGEEGSAVPLGLTGSSPASKGCCRGPLCSFLPSAHHLQLSTSKVTLAGFTPPSQKLQ